MNIHYHITNAIELHKISSEHAPALFASIEQNRTQFSQFLPWVSHTHSYEDTLQFIHTAQEWWNSTQEYVLSIIYHNTPVGTLSIRPHASRTTDDIHKETYAEFGYWLDSAVQKQGIITQCILYMHAILTPTPYTYTAIKCAPNNNASNAIARRCGYRFIEIHAQAECVNGIYYDHNIYHKP